MKKTLYYVCPWAASRVNTWSGTCNSLFLALEKRYTLDDIDTGYINNRTNWRVKSAYFADAIKRKLFNVNDMGLNRIKLFNRLVKNQIPEGSTVFSFEECPDSVSYDSYIYLDLAVNYIYDIFQRDSMLYSDSGFGKIKERELKKRLKSQERFFTNTAGVFTMGNWLKNYLINQTHIAPEKVHCVGGGFNLNPDLIDDSQKVGNKVLFVGRDFNRKNGPLVVEAFKIAKKQRPDLELHIIGPQNLDLDAEGVFVHGNMDYEKIYHYFNMCDIFCMPSRFEAYGLVFPEALTYGLPCIGRDAFEMPYFIEDGKTGYLLKEDNADLLAELILRLIDNKAIKENVQKKRDFYLKEYSWDTVVERMAQVIGE